MSADGWLAGVGIVAGAAGIAVSVALTITTRTLPADGARPALARAVPPGPLRRSLAWLRRLGRGIQRIRSWRPGNRAPRPRDYSGDDLVAYAALAFIALALLAVGGVAFAQAERTAVRAAAVVAIITSLLEVYALVRYARVVRLGRHLPWLVLMFLGNAGVALAPQTFARPLMGQGRFDDLALWVPRDGSLAERARESLKIWNLGLVFHVLAQAVGLTMLVVAALGSAVFVVRQLRRSTPRQARRSFVAALVLVVAGVVLTSGVAAALPSRVRGEAVWTTGATTDSVGSLAAPPLALQTDKTGALSLLLARCGRDRLLELRVDDIPRGQDQLGVPATAPVTRVRIPRGTAPVTVRFRTTRSSARTVVFPTRPKAGGFVPAKSGVTPERFAKAGFGC